MAGFPIKALGNDIAKYSRIIVQNHDRIIGYEFPYRNYRVEDKCRMVHKGFQAVWNKGAIKHKRSYQVGKYFMEWESFESERKKWLGEIDYKLRGFEEITV